MNSTLSSILNTPNLRQNTANYKLNYGLPYDLELDVDAPHLSVFRALRTPTSTGTDDTNLGVKWNFHKEPQTSRPPALGASLYIEFLTGDTRRQLGSGLTDYWLNLAGQKREPQEAYCLALQAGGRWFDPVTAHRKNQEPSGQPMLATKLMSTRMST